MLPITDDLWFPRIPPSIVPLTIVAGPPCAGKSTFVRRYADPDDVVIDLDQIAARLAGSGEHDWDRNEWLTAALEVRNYMLSRLSEDHTIPHAWFVISGLNSRGLWESILQPERTIILMPDFDVCINRLNKGKRRDRGQVENLIYRWYDRFKPREGEHVIRTG